jgi:hypothetical protein
MKKSQMSFLAALLLIAPHLAWSEAFWVVVALNIIGFALAVWDK